MDVTAARRAIQMRPAGLSAGTRHAAVLGARAVHFRTGLPTSTLHRTWPGRATDDAAATAARADAPHVAFDGPRAVDEVGAGAVAQARHVTAHSGRTHDGAERLVAVDEALAVHATARAGRGAAAGAAVLGASIIGTSILGTGILGASVVGASIGSYLAGPGIDGRIRVLSHVPIVPAAIGPRNTAVPPRDARIERPSGVSTWPVGIIRKAVSKSSASQEPDEKQGCGVRLHPRNLRTRNGSRTPHYCSFPGSPPPEGPSFWGHFR